MSEEHLIKSKRCINTFRLGSSPLPHDIFLSTLNHINNQSKFVLNHKLDDAIILVFQLL